MLSQPPKQHYRYVLDINCEYANFIGRQLPEYELRVVHALELKRLVEEHAHFISADQDPLFDSRCVIICYVD